MAKCGTAKGDALVPPGKKADDAYDFTRDKIIRCEYAPGSILIEKNVIDQTGLGRTPVREAMVRLIYDGLLEVEPRVGYRVTELTEESIRDLFLVWRTIAPLMVREAGRRMTDDQRTSIGLKTEKIAASSATLSARKLHREVAGVFDGLSALCGSQHLQHIYERLRNELERVYTLYLSTPEGRQWASTLNSRSMIEIFSNVQDTYGVTFAEVDTSLEGILTTLRHRRSRGFR